MQYDQEIIGHMTDLDIERLVKIREIIFYLMMESTKHIHTYIKIWNPRALYVSLLTIDIFMKVQYKINLKIEVQTVFGKFTVIKSLLISKFAYILNTASG